MEHIPDKYIDEAELEEENAKAEIDEYLEKLEDGIIVLEETKSVVQEFRGGKISFRETMERVEEIREQHDTELLD